MPKPSKNTPSDKVFAYNLVDQFLYWADQQEDYNGAKHYAVFSYIIRRWAAKKKPKNMRLPVADLKEYLLISDRQTLRKYMDFIYRSGVISLVSKGSNRHKRSAIITINSHSRARPVQPLDMSLDHALHQSLHPPLGGTQDTVYTQLLTPLSIEEEYRGRGRGIVSREMLSVFEDDEIRATAIQFLRDACRAWTLRTTKYDDQDLVKLWLSITPEDHHLIITNIPAWIDFEANDKSEGFRRGFFSMLDQVDLTKPPGGPKQELPDHFQKYNVKAGANDPIFFIQDGAWHRKYSENGLAMKLK